METPRHNDRKEDQRSIEVWYSSHPEQSLETEEIDPTTEKYAGHVLQDEDEANTTTFRNTNHLQDTPATGSADIELKPEKDVEYLIKDSGYALDDTTRRNVEIVYSESTTERSLQNELITFDKQKFNFSKSRSHAIAILLQQVTANSVLTNAER